MNGWIDDDYFLMISKVKSTNTKNMGKMKIIRLLFKFLDEFFFIIIIHSRNLFTKFSRFLMGYFLIFYLLSSDELACYNFNFNKEIVSLA